MQSWVVRTCAGQTILLGLQTCGPSARALRQAAIPPLFGWRPSKKSVLLMVGQQVVLNVPQLLGQVHIVVVGVVEPLHGVPHGVHLVLAVLLDLRQG